MTSADSVSAGQALTAFGFGSVRDSVRAAHRLRDLGFDVQVAARRTPGCGVLVLVPSELAPGAGAALEQGGIKPHEVGPHGREGGGP